MVSLRCTFCGRQPTVRGDLVTGFTKHICVSCVVDAVHALLAPGRRLDALAAGAGDAPCSFCRRSTLSSELRLRRRRGVICAACVAEAVQLLTASRDEEAVPIPIGLARELRRGVVALAREFPDWAIAFRASADRDLEAAP